MIEFWMSFREIGCEFSLGLDDLGGEAEATALREFLVRIWRSSGRGSSDRTRAWDPLKQAATDRDIDAAFYLGTAYMRDIGVRKPSVGAREVFRQAAERGLNGVANS